MNLKWMKDVLPVTYLRSWLGRIPESVLQHCTKRSRWLHKPKGDTYTLGRRASRYLSLCLDRFRDVGRECSSVPEDDWFTLFWWNDSEKQLAKREPLSEVEYIESGMKQLNLGQNESRTLPTSVHPLVIQPAIQSYHAKAAFRKSKALRRDKRNRRKALRESKVVDVASANAVTEDQADMTQQLTTKDNAKSADEINNEAAVTEKQNHSPETPSSPPAVGKYAESVKVNGHSPGHKVPVRELISSEQILGKIVQQNPQSGNGPSETKPRGVATATQPQRKDSKLDVESEPSVELLAFQREESAKFAAIKRQNENRQKRQEDEKQKESASWKATEPIQIVKTVLKEDKKVGEQGASSADVDKAKEVAVPSPTPPLNLWQKLAAEGEARAAAEEQAQQEKEAAEKPAADKAAADWASLEQALCDPRPEQHLRRMKEYLLDADGHPKWPYNPPRPRKMSALDRKVDEARQQEKAIKWHWKSVLNWTRPVEARKPHKLVVARHPIWLKYCGAARWEPYAHKSLDEVKRMAAAAAAPPVVYSRRYDPDDNNYDNDPTYSIDSEDDPTDESGDDGTDPMDESSDDEIECQHTEYEQIDDPMVIETWDGDDWDSDGIE